MIAKSALQIIKYRWLVLFCSLAAVAVAGYGLHKIAVITDYEVFFDGDNQRLMALRDIEVAFGRRDTVELVLAVKSGAVFEPQILTAIESLTQSAWQMPYSRRVDSLTNFPYTRADGDDFFVSDLFEDSMNMRPAEIELRRQFALSEPALANAINAKQTVTGILVTINLPEHNPAATREVSDYARQLSADFGAAHPELDVYVSGSILLNDAFFTAATAGTAKLLLIMFVLMLITVAVLLRSIATAVMILLLMLLSIISGVGLATWLGIPLTAPSSSAPVIITALVVANTVHLMAVMLKTMRQGGSKTDGIVQTVQANFRPVFLTSLTTVIGFLCLNTGDVPPYRYLGTTAALGVSAAFILTFTFLPALLAVIPIRVKTSPMTTSSGLDRWAAFADFVVTRRAGLLLFCLVLALVIGPLALLNKVDDRLLTYFDKDVPIRVNSEFAMANLAPFYAVSYAIQARDKGGISEPEYLQNLEKFSAWARAQPEVMFVSVLSDTMKRINRSMHGDDPAWYTIPEDRLLSSQYLVLYELSLPFGQDLTNQINMDQSATKVYVGFHDISSSQMRGFDTKSSLWMNDNLPGYMVAPATGPPLLFAYIWDSATRSNLLGMVIAVLLISIVIAIAMRSVKLGLISLAPNLIPPAMAFGVWGLINGQLDIGTSIVAVVSFGIIVDDTIHFLSKYRSARIAGASAEDAVRFGFTSVGRALLITTIALIIGFSVLTTSSFTLNSSMGLLTSIVIAFALVMDFLLLPVLLMLLDGKTSANEKSEKKAAISAMEAGPEL